MGDGHYSRWTEIMGAGQSRDLERNLVLLIQLKYHLQFQAQLKGGFDIGLILIWDVRDDVDKCVPQPEGDCCINYCSIKQKSSFNIKKSTKNSFQLKK